MIIRSTVSTRILSPRGQQVRHATLIRRPHRPYTFTQLVTLTDGSTFLHRTTSPQPIYRTTKDVKNSVLWNPSSQKLANVEDDEAGRLARFRERFGRGWDAESGERDLDIDDGGEEMVRTKEQRATNTEGYANESDESGLESLMDLIGQGYQGVKGSSKAEKTKKAATKGKK